MPVLTDDDVGLGKVLSDEDVGLGDYSVTEPTESEKAAASLADTQKLIRETRTIQRDALARHPNLEANTLGFTEAMGEPVISPESATKAAAALISRIPISGRGVHPSTLGPSTPGGLQQGLEQFIGENVSGLSTPTTAGAIAATPLAPEIMLPLFAKQSIEAMPEHTRQMIQGETAAEKLKGGLGLGLDALIAKGTGTGALHAHAALPEQIMNHPLSDAEIASLPSLGTKPMANLDVNPAEINVPQGVVGQPRVNPGALLRPAGVTEPIPKPPIDIPDEGVSTGGTGTTEQLAQAKPISRGLPDVGTNVQWITGEGDKPQSGQVIELRFDANTEQFAPIVRTAEGETLSLDGWMTGQVKPRTALMAKPEAAAEPEPVKAATKALAEAKAPEAVTPAVTEVPPKATEFTPPVETSIAAEPAKSEPITITKNKVGKAFNSLIEKMGRDEVGALLGDWNESELSEDGTKINFTDTRGGGGKWSETKSGFFQWLFSDEPLDPKQYDQAPEWVSRIDNARKIASEHATKPTEPPKPVEPPKTEIADKERLWEATYPNGVKEQFSKESYPDKADVERLIADRQKPKEPTAVPAAEGKAPVAQAQAEVTPELAKYKRKTPAKGTPERDAIEAKWQEWKTKSDPLYDQITDLQEKRDRTKAYSKARDALDKRLEKIREQRDKLDEQYKAVREQVRDAYREDRLEHPNPVVRLKQMDDLGLTGTGKESGYERVKQLVFDEAKRQGATDAEAKQAGVDAYSFTVDENITIPELVKRRVEAVRREARKRSIPDFVDTLETNNRGERQDLIYRLTNFADDPAKFDAEKQKILSQYQTKEQVREFVEKQSAENAKAKAELEAKFSKAIKTETASDARHAKTLLIKELESVLKEAPDEVGPGKVTIEIPGDGTFKVPNHKAAVAEVLARAKRLATNSTPPKPFTERLPSAAERKSALEESQQLAKEPPASPSVGPGVVPPSKPGPYAMGIVPPGSDVVFQAIQWAKGIPANARAWINQLAGKSAPRTSAASPESGNALIHYASSKLAAPLVARSMATDVLGELDHDEGRARLGAVLVEDRLRAIRLGLAKAGDPGAAQVETVIGKPWSVLKNEADFQAALADPEIQAAIERHKKTVQPMAEAAHQQARGALAGPGLNTGAFVNLKAILDTPEAERFAQGGRGNLANPLQRLSRFFRQARGTAARYEVDYRTLAQRMVEGNFEESAKRTMNEQLVKDGLAVITDPGEPRPTIGGKPAVKFSIERRGIPFGDGRARTYIQDLWVRHDLAGEYRQAINTDGQVGHAGMVAAANLLNRIQLAGPTDAVWHTANMLASIATSQGGRTLLADLGRKLPGVNLADAIGRVTMSAIKVFRDSPEIQKQLAELAQMGALRAEHAGKSEWLGRAIQFIDKAGRLVRDDLYQNLVKRKLVPDTEAARREWINQMGQYNGRLMGQFQRFFKEAGFSPFIVAGRNFNRMAMRKMILSPGVEATSPGAAAEMRAVEAFGMVGTLIAIPALINYLMTGSPAGSPGIKFGQIDTGKKDKDGKAIVIDPAQWTGVRRGLRISGAQSVIEGLRQHEGGKAIAANASKDILGGILHPWTGPAVTAASVAKTGYDTRFYKQSANPKDVGENVKAALGQLNPVAASLIKAHENDSTPVGEMGKNLVGAFGVKEQRTLTAKDQMRDLHSAWLRTNPDPKVKADYERNEQAQYPTSKYKDVDMALAKGDNKAALDAINELLKTEKKQQIWERFQKQSHGPIFQESAKNEGAFIKTLTPDQQKIYIEAKKEQTKKFEQFKAVWKAKWTP